MRATEHFLQLIWPPSGEKAIVSISAGSVRHYWFRPHQVSEAAAKAVELSGTGAEVYMALAGFDTHDRTSGHVLALKALFLDIDCGPEETKNYPDQGSARTALETFVGVSGLPEPLVLSSGYGLHVYWPLDQEVKREDWLTLALSLKSLCKEHGFNTDQKVTADAARILRPIGTHNFKNGTPRRVAALTAGNICVTKDLRTILLTPASIFEAMAKQQIEGARPKDTEFSVEYPPVDFDDILPRCATLRYAYENQNEVREPLWYASLGVANYCNDAMAVGHRLSSGHAGYDRGVTERKQSQWRDAVSGPPTCETFKQCPGNRCVGCPETVSTPVLLGRPKNTRPTLFTLVNNTPKYADPWLKVTKHGLLVKSLPEKPDRDGNIPPPSWTKIADYGVQPLLNLRLHDRNGQPENYVWMESHDENYLPLQNFVVPAVSINSSPLLATDFARQGILNELETSPAAFRTFAKVMRTWVEKLKKEQGSTITFKSFGWVGPDGGSLKDSFLLGTKLYTPTGIREAPLIPALQEYQADLITHGTLDAWTRAMNGYSRAGMEPYMFATWTAFAAPLMGFTYSGNLVFNLVGDTGVGKSSMQKSIISTYGKYDSKILLDQHDSTLHSVNANMSLLNSIPYCREELSEKDAEEISTWVLTMTQGRDRGRLDMNRKMASVGMWNTIAVTSSNMSIREIVATTRKDNAARLARVWEQDVLLPISQEEAMHLFAPLRTNYGHALPVFVDYVVRNYEEVKNAVITTENQLMSMLKAQGPDRFNISLLAACFVAAQIAFNLGLIDHNLQAGKKYAINQYKRLRRNAKAEQQTSEQILCRFLQDMQPNTLVVEYDAPGTVTTVFNSLNNVIRAPSVNAIISARYVANGGAFFVATNTIRKWFVENHLNFQLTMDQLKRLGLLVDVEQPVVLTRGTKLADKKQIRCCCFDLSKSTELIDFIGATP